MTENLVDADEQYLERLKKAKDKAAVLKHQLMSTRSELPDTVIFVFEGDEDKTVYFNWSSKIRQDLEYEPFVCRGKRKVLQLRDSVLKDRGNLSDGIYFFVDRDFDDLGRHVEHINTFMTDFYSVENYLVSACVLKEFLRNEFHCHGNPKARAPIVEAFEKLYGSFLAVTKEVNFRIFAARRLKINMPGLPDKINSVVTISLEDVKIGDMTLQELIKLDREPTLEEIARLTDEFNSLVPFQRYRGKFALKFFEKWLDLLAADYGLEATTYFSAIDRTAKVKRAEITLGSMASKSTFPENLPDFLARVSAPQCS